MSDGAVDHDPAEPGCSRVCVTLPGSSTQCPEDGVLGGVICLCAVTEDCIGKTKRNYAVAFEKFFRFFLSAPIRHPNGLVHSSPIVEDSGWARILHCTIEIFVMWRRRVPVPWHRCRFYSTPD